MGSAIAAATRGKVSVHYGGFKVHASPPGNRVWEMRPRKLSLLGATKVVGIGMSALTWLKAGFDVLRSGFARG